MNILSFYALIFILHSTLERLAKYLNINLTLASHELDNIEQYSRRDNLVITGNSASFSEATSSGTNKHIEQTIDKVIELCRDKLGNEVTPSDISTAHRIKLKSDRGLNAASIIVCFTRRFLPLSLFNLSLTSNGNVKYCKSRT